MVGAVIRRTVQHDLLGGKILRLQEFEQLRQDDIRIHTGDLAGQRLVDVLVSDLMETAA